MSLADEIQKLRDLHQAGALNDAEFESAKARLLAAGPPPLPASSSPPPMPAYTPPPPVPAPAAPADSRAALNQWAMILHLSMLAGFVVPLAGLVAPIVIWQMKKKEIPGLDAHGCHAANWIITVFICGIVFALLCLVIIGIPLLIVLGVVSIVFPVIAAVKASNGELWRYPMSFDFVKPQPESPAL